MFTCISLKSPAMSAVFFCVFSMLGMTLSHPGSSLLFTISSSAARASRTLFLSASSASWSLSEMCTCTVFVTSATPASIAVVLSSQVAMRPCIDAVSLCMAARAFCSSSHIAWRLAVLPSCADESSSILPLKSSFDLRWLPTSASTSSILPESFWSCSSNPPCIAFRISSMRACRSASRASLPSPPPAPAASRRWSASSSWLSRPAASSSRLPPPAAPRRSSISASLAAMSSARVSSSRCCSRVRMSPPGSCSRLFGRSSGARCKFSVAAFTLASRSSMLLWLRRRVISASTSSRVTKCSRRSWKSSRCACSPSMVTKSESFSSSFTTFLLTPWLKVMPSAIFSARALRASASAGLATGWPDSRAASLCSSLETRSSSDLLGPLSSSTSTLPICPSRAASCLLSLSMMLFSTSWSFETPRRLSRDTSSTVIAGTRPHPRHGSSAGCQTGAPCDR
mmetsp:Transcript_60128/g.176436  ORF Transcript_60128/g.176436 Transcript_60128/m.176436 type:complete len:454 (-) Transcript_60128:56-1417(-)